MIRALFVCSQNRLRSPTAEHVFSTWEGVEVDSAGLGSDAIVQLSVEQIEWASIIFVMEQSHRNKLSKRFKAHLNGKLIICLSIPDEYDYMDSDLVRLLEEKVSHFLALPNPSFKRDA